MQSLYVGSSGAEDAQMCLELCRENKNCLYFTFYGDKKECTNFGNCEVFSTDTCSNCVSGASACEGTNKFNIKLIQLGMKKFQIIQLTPCFFTHKTITTLSYVAFCPLNVTFLLYSRHAKIKIKRKKPHLLTKAIFTASIAVYEFKSYCCCCCSCCCCWGRDTFQIFENRLFRIKTKGGALLPVPEKNLKAVSLR